MTKSEIRTQALERRNALTPEERHRASMTICRAVMDHTLFDEARGIHVYMPVASEVDIEPLIEVAWEMGKSVGMMYVNEDGGSQQLEITSETEFTVSGRLGIRQPVDATPFDMNECDMVIVPMVAVDPDCNRLGYGKGYYDQFLSLYPRPTIGVAFDVQVFDEIPVDEGDISLDIVYTEARVLPPGADTQGTDAYGTDAYGTDASFDDDGADNDNDE